MNLEKYTSKKSALVSQLIALAVLVTAVVLFLRWWNNQDPKTGFEIEHTPMQVEVIKNIAQLAAVSYEDEVVVDSVEYYQNAAEQISGNLQKLTDVENFKHGLSASNVKRRLTLIVQGEIRIGFDLKDKGFSMSETDSVVTIRLPKPKILDVLTTPSSTRVFQENGVWEDYEIRALRNKSRRKMTDHAKELNLNRQAEENIKKLLRQMIKKQKELRFEFV